MEEFTSIELWETPDNQIIPGELVTETDREAMELIPVWESQQVSDLPEWGNNEFGVVPGQEAEPGPEMAMTSDSQLEPGPELAMTSDSQVDPDPGQVWMDGSQVDQISQGDQLLQGDPEQVTDQLQASSDQISQGDLEQVTDQLQASSDQNSQTDQLQVMSRLVEVLESLEDSLESDDSAESETERSVEVETDEEEQVFIEEVTETTTEDETWKKDIKDIKATQEIIAKDQQMIGIIQAGLSGVILGAIVIWLFLGRIR